MKKLVSCVTTSGSVARECAVARATARGGRSGARWDYALFGRMGVGFSVMTRRMVAGILSQPSMDGDRPRERRE